MEFMEPATKILIAGGTFLLMYSFLLGIPLAQARKGGAEAPRYLTLAHMGGIMSGTTLLALTFATAMSTMSDGVESLAAWLLVGGAVSVAIGEFSLWQGKVADAFATRPFGFVMQSIGATLLIVGLGILTVGVIGGL